MKTGIQLRDEGIVKVSEGHQEWLSRARFIAVKLANEHGEVTSDEIWRYCPLPNGAHPNLMGAVFRDRRFCAIGFTQSTRPSAHGRTIRIYRTRAE